MNKNLAELVICLDESGSMGNVVNDTIGGFNTFIETHKSLPGHANLTLIKFNTSYNMVYNGVDIQDVSDLDKKTYSPGGMTALLDAVGTAIDEVGKRYDALKKKEKPGKVIFLIITDGEENSSQEYTLNQIKEKTKTRQEKNKWEFIFMGADQDAWMVGTKMGVANTVNYTVNDIERTIKAATYYSVNSRSYSATTSLDMFSLSDTDLNKELDKVKNNNK